MNRSYPQTSRLFTCRWSLVFVFTLTTAWSVGYANPLDDLDSAERQITRESAVSNRGKYQGRQQPTTQPASQPTVHDKNRKKRKKTSRRVTRKQQAKQSRKTFKRPKFRRIRLSNAQWRRRLSSEEYRVLREKGTERKNSGKYLHNKKKGVYVCAACGHQLYRSKTKFDSGSGWPSFTKAISNGIRRKPDRSHGMNRTEIVCARCDSHLGHVFHDGPKPTGERHCVNSISLKFKSKPRR